MEKVSEIRADIARNAANIRSKILLQELRELSRIFLLFDTEGKLDDEIYSRVSIIRNAVNASDKERLRSIEIISSRALREWKHDLAPAQKSWGGCFVKGGALSKAEATRLFEENAVLMGVRDGMPVRVAVELLNEQAVKDTMRQKETPGKLHSVWSMNDRHCVYLTLEGFYRAVTIYNVNILGEGSLDPFKIYTERSDK